MGALLEILSRQQQQHQQQQQQEHVVNSRDERGQGTSTTRQKRKRSLSIVLANSALKDSKAKERIETSWRPFSLDDLVDRIASYTLGIWGDSKPAPYLQKALWRTSGDLPKPDAAASSQLSSRSAVDIGVVQFARHGWKCTGKKREEVACVTCEKTWTCPNVKDWRSVEGREMAAAVQERLVADHSVGCPWRQHPCSAD